MSRPRPELFRYRMAIKPTARYSDVAWAFDGTLSYLNCGVGSINGCATAEECFEALCHMRDQRIREGTDSREMVRKWSTLPTAKVDAMLEPAAPQEEPTK